MRPGSLSPINKLSFVIARASARGGAPSAAERRAVGENVRVVLKIKCDKFERIYEVKNFY